jgi:hypothetical protein
MLVIDKSLSGNTLLVTVSEVNDITSGSTLHLFNRYTNVSVVYNLPNDTSEYPKRYNKFELPTLTFSGLSEGTYSYEIKDSLSGITESGVLKVINEKLTPKQKVDDNYIYIPSTSLDDDYIVYTQS